MDFIYWVLILEFIEKDMVYYYKSERDRTAVAIDESVKIRKIHPTITIDRKKEMAIGPFMYCYLEFMTSKRPISRLDGRLI